MLGTLISLFFRLVIIPIVAVLGLAAASATMAPGFVAVVFWTIVINLIVSQFQADARRIADLEDGLEQLRRKLRDAES